MVHMVRRSLLTSPVLPPLLGALVSSLLRGSPGLVLKYPFIENVLNAFSSMGQKLFLRHPKMQVCKNKAQW